MYTTYYTHVYIIFIYNKPTHVIYTLDSKIHHIFIAFTYYYYYYSFIYLGIVFCVYVYIIYDYVVKGLFGSLETFYNVFVGPINTVPIAKRRERTQTFRSSRNNKNIIIYAYGKYTHTPPIDKKKKKYF